MYDAIVIGARCAGSPTAMLLARQGWRVLLVDRATFPSDTMSTHLVWQAGVARLKRWGLLETLRASNCPPITRFKLDFAEAVLEGSPPPAEGGVGEAYAPRRMVLDKILVDAAAAAGVEVREGFAVQEILTDGDRVTGIRGAARGGAPVTERTRIVIGADGKNSVVARAVQAPKYREKPPLECGYYTYWSGAEVSGVEIYVREGRGFGAFPTNDGLVLTIVGWAIRDYNQYRADIEGSHLQTLNSIPEFAARVRCGRRVERFAGTGDLPNYFRKPYGPGWALVGDAGYHKDPMTAQGITDAFRDAELLAEAVGEGLSGRRPLEEALADYERRRNEAALPMYESTCERAALGPPSAEIRQLAAALRGNQEQIDRFIGCDAGTVAIPEFFSPENMQRIFGAAQHA